MSRWRVSKQLQRVRFSRPEKLFNTVEVVLWDDYAKKGFIQSFGAFTLLLFIVSASEQKKIDLSDIQFISS